MNFKLLLQRYSAMLGRIVASYEADSAQQQELLQEVSLALWRAMPKFRGEGSEKAFIARVAQNRCISHVAKAASAPRQTILDDNMICGNEGPEVQVARDQQRQQLLAAVRGLPLTLREVTTLALEGFSHREIAETLGISENNAMVRFSRAKEALKRTMVGEAEANDVAQQGQFPGDAK